MDLYDRDRKGPQSDDTLSDVSQISAEDDFDRRMIQAARDERRLRNATKGGIQAFRNKRSNVTLSSTMQTLGRPQAAGEVDVDGMDRSPPVKAVRDWARKGKQKKEFLRRIIGEELKPDHGVARLQEGATSGVEPKQDFDWMMVAAEEPLPTVEDDSPLRNTSGNRRHSSRRNKNTALDEIMRVENEVEQEEEQEEESSPVESPVAQASERRRRLISRPPQENAEVDRDVPAVLGRRWGGLPDSPSRTSSRSLLDGDSIIGQFIGEHSSSPGSFRSPKSPRSPMTSLKSSGTIGFSSLEVEGKADASGARASLQRQDSRALLRQLSRAKTSPTSSFKITDSISKRSMTGKDKEEHDQRNEERREKIERKRSELSESSDCHVSDHDRPASVLKAQDASRPSSPDERHPSSRRASRPIHTAMRNRLPAPPDEAEDVQEVQHDLVPKTPVVTGAWVETPFPQRRKDSTSSSKNSQPAVTSRERASPSAQPAQPEASVPRPSRPQSAAAAIIAASTTASIPPDETIGDSTIASIRALADRDLNSNPQTTDITLDDETLNLIAAVNTPATTTAHDRAQEDLAVRRMRTRLRAVRTGLRDASEGMKRVEREIETAEAASAATAHKCPAAGADDITLSSLVRKACRYFRSYFYTLPPGRRWRWLPRLTWLGLATLLFAVWCVSEVALCGYYCHPIYADSMVGYGVDVRAPVMPFVTSTLLLARPTEWVWRPLAAAMGVDVRRTAYFPGWANVRYGEQRRDWTSELRASQGLDLGDGDGVEVDWSMLDDEYV